MHLVVGGEVHRALSSKHSSAGIYNKERKENNNNKTKSQSRIDNLSHPRFNHILLKVICTALPPQGPASGTYSTLKAMYLMDKFY
eukprot:scaffold14037_cov32-Cyclotella_meneghiniana.AAC.2